MKKVLITGKTSYVGTKFAEYVEEHYADSIVTESISVREDAWKSHDFSQYDVVLHVAGIAHVSTDPKMEDLYYRVNRDLTIEVAKKAKVSGIKQFIFMSSMIVFGRPKDGVVTINTKPCPENFYGRSKLEAEEELRELESNEFKVAILRPPIIYGPGSKGNYSKLAKFARVTPVFPNYPNKRSMLFIDNLSIFIEDIIKNNKSGSYHPQNNEYVQTSELVKEISKIYDKKIYTVRLFNPIIKQLTKIPFINKIFGNLYYDDIINNNNIDFKESIKQTEQK